MGKTLLITLVALFITMPAHAEIQTYEDDYVSFQYDDDIEGFISRHIWGGKINYNFDTRDSSSILVITCDSKNKEKYIENMNDSDNTVFFDEDDKLVFAYILPPDKENGFYSTLCESVVLPDTFNTDGYMIPDGIDSLPIYRNYSYSKQALTYARKALDICNEYLNFEIDGDEAGNQIKTISNRVKDFMDSSDDPGDSDVYFALPSEMSFTLNKDEEIIESKNHLEIILSSKE